jgi:hypothetical protein
VAALQLHSALYVILQCTGAIAGAALSAALMPARDIFFGDGGGGCFDRMSINKLLSGGQIFGCADCVCSAAKHTQLCNLHRLQLSRAAWLCTPPTPRQGVGGGRQWAIRQHCHLGAAGTS